MNHPRHYPGVVELADGKVLVAGGVSRAISGTESLGVRRTETYDPAADSWTENHTGPESETALPLQPRLFLAPNGKVFYNGVGELWGSAGQGVDQALYGMQRFFDPRTKQWEAVGPSPYGARSDAFEIPLMLDPPYDQMTLLTVGGTLGGVGGAGMHLATVTTVDRLGNFFANRTAEMRHPRWSPSGVLLPDGGVFVVGGAYKDEVTSPGVPVTAPELYNPYKGEWREMADQARDRTYHHSALLLPDMRVLVGGHAPAVTAAGAEGAQLFSAGEPDASFEIWSPPYLYRGDRPKITRVQAGIAFGQRFPLGTPEAGDIEAVVLLRTPSPQHGSDSDQRGLLLEFERTGSTMLTVKAPPDGVAAPPGYYYLVVRLRNNFRGVVPSVARIVHVGETGDLTEALQPYPDDAPAPGAATVPDDAPGAGGEDSPDPAAVGRAVREALDGLEPPYTPEEPVSGPAAPGIRLGTTWWSPLARVD